MIKIKKIHKIIILFILIFILGVYSFTLYINNTIDQNPETHSQSEYHNSALPDRQATELN